MSSQLNVVILGNVGTGKKTLGNHIVDKEIFQPEGSLGTRKVNTHCEEEVLGDTVYRILTVDTESLETGYFDPLQCIRAQFKMIHLIIFVIANGCYTDESHSSLMHVVRHLDQGAEFSALVITHCEGITNDHRERIIKDFKSDHRSSKLADFMRKGVYTVGFPESKSPQLKVIYQNEVKEDEKIIRELVKGCKKSLSVEKLSEHDVKLPIKQLSSPSRQQPSPRISSHQENLSYRHEVSPDSPVDRTCDSPTKLQGQNPCSQSQNLGEELMDRRARTEATERSTIKPPQLPKRSVIVLGTVGSGKKTLVNHISNTPQVICSSNATRDVAEHPIKEITTGEALCRVQIIDTNSSITDYNEPLQHIKSNTVHLIIFVIAYTCFNDENHGVLMTVKHSLSDKAMQISALVITHCEGFDAQVRKEIISTFEKDPLARFMKKGIYPVGFPEGSLSTSTNEAIKTGIADDESMVRRLVRDCDVPYDVKTLIGPEHMKKSFIRVPIIPDQDKCLLQ